MLMMTPQIQIPLSEIEFSYVRSSGPGGQNVNKVNSKAVLRWNLRDSASLSEATRAKLSHRLANQMTSEGEIIISSDQFRDQIRNRESCLEKLQALIAAAAWDPKPRKKTRPSRSTVRKARESKTRHSAKKLSRKSSRFRNED